MTRVATAMPGILLTLECGESVRDGGYASGVSHPETAAGFDRVALVWDCPFYRTAINTLRESL